MPAPDGQQALTSPFKGCTDVRRERLNFPVNRAVHPCADRLIIGCAREFG
jgi:hypothetical protein